MYAVAIYSVGLVNSNFLPIFFVQLIFSVTPIVADVGLWFVKSPEPFVAPINDDVVFDCSLNVPAEVIRWRHGRKYLSQNRTLSPRGSANQLVIKVENESQLGDYQCVAWFGASALASVTAKLTLAEMKPFPLHQPEKRHVVTAGNMVSIFCPPPVSNPGALIQYFHDERKLNNQNMRILPTSNSLLLMHVTAQDSGIYTCSATNYITGQTMTSPLRVNLTVVPNQSVMPSAPKFLSQPQTNYIVQSGSNVTIECVAVGEPAPRVWWYKVGDLQRIPNNRTELQPGGLHMRNIVLEDTGEYVCEVDNDISPVLRHSVLLQVHEAPIIIKEPNRTLVEEQEDTELSCVVSGTPIPTVSWTLNGEPLENDNHVHISSSRLILRSVQKKHAGIYQCFATNSVGTAYGSAMLQVSPKQIMANINSSGSLYHQNENWPESIKNNRSGSSSSRNHGGRGRGKKEHQKKNKGKRKHNKDNELMVPPSKPNVTRLTDSSVMVRWHVPPNNGLLISFFKVQHRECDANETGKSRPGGNRWMTSNEDIASHVRSYEVCGLMTNRYYKFRIATVYSNNDNKLSPSSSKFYLHHGTPAERSQLTAPIHLHAEALSPTSIEITWIYLHSVLSPVDGFYIYYRMTNNAGEYVKATVEGEKTRSFVITHLEADTLYDIKIQSFTIGAASNFSAIVSQRTQIDPNATADNPSRNDPKTPTVNLLPSATFNSVQLLFIFGGILIGSIVICSIFVLRCYFRERTFRDSSNEDENTPDKNNDNIISIHPIEPVTMNGYTNHSTHNGNSYHGKMNGNAVKTHNIRNGYIAPHSHMNITSNPLATDIKHEKNMMEMSYLSKYNNNCTIDRCGDSDSDCSRDINKWKRPTEKYINVVPEDTKSSQPTSQFDNEIIPHRDSNMSLSGGVEVVTALQSSQK